MNFMIDIAQFVYILLQFRRPRVALPADMHPTAPRGALRGMQHSSASIR